LFFLLSPRDRIPLMSDPSPVPELRVTSYVKVAIITFLVCEHFGTLPREVNLIWKSRWSAVKILFLISRYMPYIWTVVELGHSVWLLDGSPGSNRCSQLLVPLIWIKTFIRIAAEAFFCLEAYAICHRSRAILVLFCVAASAIIIARIVVNALDTLFENNSVPLPAGCAVVARSPSDVLIPESYGTVNFASGVTCCTILLLCIIFTRWQQHRYGIAMTPMITKIYQGALLFYVAQIGLAIISFTTDISPDFQLDLLMANVIAARVILDVREIGVGECYTSTILRVSKAASTLKFFRPTLTQPESTTRGGDSV